MLAITPYHLAEQERIAKLMFALNSEDSEELPLTNEKVAKFFDFVKTSSSTELFTIKSDDVLIGYCIVNIFYSNEFGGDCLEIDELYIQPEFRDKGIGTQTLNFLEEYARDHKLLTMFLIATNSNVKAQNFYERLGFKKLPRIEYIKDLRQ